MHGIPWSNFADAALGLAAAQMAAGSASAGPKSSAQLDIAPDEAEARARLDQARVAFQTSLADDNAFSSLVGNAAMSIAEAEAFAVCAAIAADVRRQRLVGWLQDDLNATEPGLDLLGRLLSGHRSGSLAVGPMSRPARAALISVAESGPWGARAVSVEPSVLWALAGDAAPDPNLPVRTEFIDSLTLGSADLALVTGPDRIKRRREAMALTAATRFVVSPHPESATQWRAVIREATMRGSGVIIECEEDLTQEGRLFVEWADHLAWAITSPFEISTASLPDRPWTERHVAGAQADPAEWESLIGTGATPRHRLTSTQLASVSEISANLDGNVDHAVRRLTSGRIDRLARRIRPRYEWDDLILDDEHTEQLRELVARYRNTAMVYGEWGFRAVPSAGLIALFSGDPGTGKTMSAEILAGELGLDMFVVNLSAVVSKYIGETEKNLEEVFDAATAGNQVLFFDEADSLFGKRTEVSDARDRYANLEVSYLLQRLEIFDGLVVLATNFSANIDAAFLRRIDVSIDFVQPSEPERQRLWAQAFPPNAPLADDVTFGDLATAYELSGGSIRKAALYAGFLAAEARTDIGHGLIAHAVNREYQKLGRLRPGRNRR